jgi:hypothetical protein
MLGPHPPIQIDVIAEEFLWSCCWPIIPNAIPPPALSSILPPPHLPFGQYAHNFRNGEATLPACGDAQQAGAHPFENHFWQPV